MTIDATPLFWIYWILTVAICGWMILRGIRDQVELLGFLPLVGIIWSYFFGYMAIQSVFSLGDYLTPESVEFGELISLICLIGLAFGWNTGFRKHGSDTVPAGTYNYNKLWWIGIGLVVVGTVAYRSFEDTTGMDFKDTSGYWYMMCHLVYPGAALALLALVRRSRLRTRANIVLLAALLVIAVGPFIVSARRGPFFTLMIVLIFTPALTGGWRPRPVTLLFGLVVVGTVMVMFVFARQSVYHTSDAREGWATALTSISIDDLTSARASQLADNEFAYHCGAVVTTRQSGLYQYGTGDLSLLLHWIPRRVWPDKPELGRGWMEPVETEIPVVMGWSMINGGAIGGPAGSFNQYGYLAPLFWFFMARLFARIYSRAVRANDPRSQISWVCILASTHWLIAQGFKDAFVPAVIYQAVSLLALRTCVDHTPAVLTEALDERIA